MKKYNFMAAIQSIFRRIKIIGTGRYTYYLLHANSTKVTLETAAARIKNLEMLTKQNLGQHHSIKNELKFNKVILLTPTHVQRSGITLEADLHFAYSESLHEIGIPVQTIETSTNLNIDEFHEGTLVIFDGNFSLKFSSDMLNQIALARNKGCYIAFDHTDLLASKDANKILSELYKIADVGIIHNPLIDLPENFRKRTILWPTYPFSKIFESEKLIKKDDSVLFSGTSFRGLNGRKFYLNYLSKHKVSINNQMLLSKSTGQIHTSYLDYLRSLESCTMSFTTGYRSNEESLLVFRVVELMLRETVVFYEEGSFINHFFKPYEHYIPVFNAPDLLYKVNYLQNNQELLNKIASQAKEFTQRKYAHYLFWKKLNEKL